MKNIISIFFLSLMCRSGSEVLACMAYPSTAIAQPTPNISGGGFINQVGMVQSAISTRSLLPVWSAIDGVRVFIRDERMAVEWRASDSTWHTVSANDPTKITMAEAEGVFMQMADTFPGQYMTTYAAMGAIGGIDTRIDDTAAALRTAINQRVKYTDTSAMLSPYARNGLVNAGLALKQDLLVSGTNIKTVNGTSLLGSGNVTTTSGTVASVGLTSSDFSISGSPVTSSGSIIANLNTSGISAGTYAYLTVNNKGIATTGSNYTINLTPGRSIVTTASAANGWQISADKVAFVSYSVSIGTSVSLSGNSSGYVVLEVAATNSTTAADWKEISRVTSGQSGSLVVGLVLNQVGGAPMQGIVPAGYYVRQRSVNVAGTPTYTVNGQEETY